MKVVCVGDVGVDHYLPSGEERCGGITANFARHAKTEFSADDEVHIISCIGDDAGADLVRASLAAADIDCHASTLPGVTPTQYIEIESDGERKFVRYEPGVLKDFEFSQDQQDLIVSSDLLVAPVFVQIIGLFHSLLAMDRIGITAVDFADFREHPDFELLENVADEVDIGFFGMSVEDADAIDRIASLAAAHDKLFVVTLGVNGSRAFQGAKEFECATVPVEKVVDTTGAGDAFAAGFLSRYCRGADVETSMQHGAELAAATITKLGG